MAGMLLVVWGVALLVLLGLGALLVWTLRSSARTVQEAPIARVPLAPAPDTGLVADGTLASVTHTLLLYHEETSVCRTPSGDVRLRVPGSAWEPEWLKDLVRLEVTSIDPGAVPAPQSWGEVLAAYDLRAHRMTEIGTDIPVEEMAAPVDVFLVTEREREGLRFGINNDGLWTLAPEASLSLDVLEQAGLPATCGWAAASMARLRPVCLVRMP